MKQLDYMFDLSPVLHWRVVVTLSCLLIVACPNQSGDVSVDEVLSGPIAELVPPVAEVPPTSDVPNLDSPVAEIPTQDLPLLEENPAPINPPIGADPREPASAEREFKFDPQLGVCLNSQLQVGLNPYDGKNLLPCTQLSGVQFSNTQLVGVDLRGSDLSQSLFENVTLIDVDFSFANLTGARFNRTRAEDLEYEGAILVGVQQDSGEIFFSQSVPVVNEPLVVAIPPGSAPEGSTNSEEENRTPASEVLVPNTGESDLNETIANEANANETIAIDPNANSMITQSSLEDLRKSLELLRLQRRELRELLKTPKSNLLKERLQVRQRLENIKSLKRDYQNLQQLQSEMLEKMRERLEFEGALVSELKRIKSRLKDLKEAKRDAEKFKDKAARAAAVDQILSQMFALETEEKQLMEDRKRTLENHKRLKEEFTLGKERIEKTRKWVRLELDQIRSIKSNIIQKRASMAQYLDQDQKLRFEIRKIRTLIQQSKTAQGLRSDPPLA